MTEAPVADDTPLRKARGAFFTPAPIAEFITAWAIRSAADRVLDPSCGDAAFLVPAIERLRSLGAARPSAEGVEIDGPTAYEARNRVAAAGGTAGIRVSDFFDVEPVRECEAVIGNPAYIRYQGFKGAMRAAARLAALRAGVSISALASSWAPFVIHASQFLVPGGRLGFVLPAELLSVNYAAPVRRFLFENFGSLELVLFERQVFAQAEADVVLLLAEGFGSSTGTATIRQVPGERDLVSPDAGLRWRPADPGGKWTTVLVPAAAAEVSARLIDSGGERSPATTASSLCRPPAQANWGSAGAISSPSAPREAPIFAVSSYPGNGSSPSGHRGRALGCSVRTNPCRAPPRRMSEPATTPESTKLTNVACARPGTGFPSSTRLTSS